MDKIEKLTPEQEKQVKIWHDKYFNIGTCTDASNREIAEKTVVSMLKEAGYYTNQKILWCRSWFASNLAINFLQNEALQDKIKAEFGIDHSADIIDDEQFFVNLKDKVWERYSDNLNDLGTEYASTWFEGQIDAYWICLYRYCQDVLGIEYDKQKAYHLQLHDDLAKASGRVYFFENLIVMCERPSTIKFEDKKLHCENGMAVKFRDGWGNYFLNGVKVPEWLVMTDREKLNIKNVMAIDSADVRAQGIKKLGPLIVDQGRKIEELIDPMGGKYELFDLAGVYNVEYAPHLFMRCVSTGQPFMFGVPPECKNIEEALLFYNKGRSRDNVIFSA